MSSRAHRPTARFPSEPTLDGHTDESELPLIEPDEDATPVDASRKKLLGMATDPGDETPTRHNPMGQDAALKPSYSGKEVSDPGHTPAFLYVDRGPGAGQLIPLKQGAVVVGRISTADLRINHPSVSRQHAQLTRRGDEFLVEDLGSQNGTYVNRRRVHGPTPVSPGDEITVGTALLKLRGSAGESLTHVPAVRGGRSPLSNAVKVALFAGAVGAGIAATLVYAFVHMQGGAMPPATEAAPVAAAAAPVAAEPGSRRMVIEDEPVVVDVVKGNPGAPSAVAAAEPTPAPAPTAAAAPPTRSSTSPKGSATAAAARRAAESVEAAPAADEAPAASDEGTSPARAGILARYETGKVDAAIEAAETAGDKALLADLVKFRDAFNAAKESSDVASAIRQFTVAQKVDEKLSAGWSSYGSQIKKQLGGLYARVGAHYAESGNTAEARKAFQLALKQEPGNAAAKSGLADLGDGEKKTPKRADIEDAFSE